jgi:hypothetical protein
MYSKVATDMEPREKEISLHLEEASQEPRT